MVLTVVAVRLLSSEKLHRNQRTPSKNFVAIFEHIYAIGTRLSIRWYSRRCPRVQDSTIFIPSLTG